MITANNLKKACEIFDSYDMQEWLDEIVDVDERGNVVYERDDSGNIIYLTDHFGRIMQNPFTGEPIPKAKLLQIGTRVTARRMTHIEKHICSLYGWKDAMMSSIEYIMIMLEIQGSVEGGQGSFFDDIDEMRKGIVEDDYYTLLTTALDSDATVLSVLDSTKFLVGETIYIYDDEKQEKQVVVGKPNNTQITVNKLKNDYKKDAYISHSSAVIDRKLKQFTAREWATYDVFSEVV